MYWVEIWFENGRGDSRNAKFEMVPRVGEVVTLQPELDKGDLSDFEVTRVFHADLIAHGNDERPSVKVWVTDADRT